MVCVVWGGRDIISLAPVAALFTTSRAWQSIFIATKCPFTLCLSKTETHTGRREKRQTITMPASGKIETRSGESNKQTETYAPSQPLKANSLR